MSEPTTTELLEWIDPEIEHAKGSITFYTPPDDEDDKRMIALANKRLETLNALRRLVEEREAEREKVRRLVTMLDDEIETVDKDDRHHYKPAHVQINAPLALIQVDLAARIGLAKRLKSALAETKSGDR